VTPSSLTFRARQEGVHQWRNSIRGGVTFGTKKKINCTFCLKLKCKSNKKIVATGAC